jgi:PEP-CTERM motif
VIPANGSFSLDPSNTFFGSGQYQLYVELGARVCLVDCLGVTRAVGSNLSGTANYNSTLTLDSVTLAPGETMIGQSGINYGNLHPVPEPGSIALLFGGVAGLLGATRRWSG